MGLPRNARERERGVITPAALKAVAGVLVVTFVAAGATALVVGRPWELRNNAVTTYAIDEVNLVVQLPASLSAPPKALVTDTPVERALVFGDGLLDGVFGGVSVFPRTADETTEAQVATVQEALKGRKKQNAVSSTAVEMLKLGEKTGVERTWTFPNGLEFTEAWILGDDHLVRVDAFMWPSLPSTTAMEIANRVRVVAPQ